MYCVLDINRFHGELVAADGNVREAACRYYGTDDQSFAMRCLGADITSGTREAFALAGYLQGMAFRGCSPDRIVRFLRRFAERVSVDLRRPDSGWRAYSFLVYDTRVKWEPLLETRLRAV